MKLADFDYNLPPALIAQKPVTPRDHSRLMVLDKKSQSIVDRHFFNLPDYLRAGDVLVLNKTKVFPARLIGRRKETGGKVEIFLLRDLQHGEWEALIGNLKNKLGQTVVFGKGLAAKIIKQIDEAVWVVKFNYSGKKLDQLIERLGQIPLPPYIKSAETKSKLKNQYQTVFAKTKGSVAAPTAGFHFTKPLLAKLKKQGVKIEYVTLHVGLGTFASVKTEDIKKHRMHSEWANIDAKTAARLNQAKQEGKRIIAVGTTSARTLESFASIQGRLSSGNKWTDIFIYPGYQFKFITALITNFHLPKSTLLMLISALAGRQLVMKAYQQAIKQQYRFYSFGDAMFIT